MSKQVTQQNISPPPLENKQQLSPEDRIKTFIDNPAQLTLESFNNPDTKKALEELVRNWLEINQTEYGISVPSLNALCQADLIDLENYLKAVRNTNSGEAIHDLIHHIMSQLQTLVGARDFFCKEQRRRHPEIPLSFTESVK